LPYIFIQYRLLIGEFIMLKKDGINTISRRFGLFLIAGLVVGATSLPVRCDYYEDHKKEVEESLLESYWKLDVGEEKKLCNFSKWDIRTLE